MKPTTTNKISPYHKARLYASAAGAFAMLSAILYMLPGVWERDRLATRAMMVSTVLAHMDQAVLIVGPEKTVELWSAGAEKMFGVPERETMGKGIEWMVPDDVRPAHMLGIAHWFKHPDTRPRIVECIARKWDGSPVHIQMRIRGCYCDDKVWRLVVQCEPAEVCASEIRLPPRIGSAGPNDSNKEK